MFNAVILIRSIAKALIDTFMFFVFLRAFVLLVEMKKHALIEKYGNVEGQLSGYNRFIIVSTYVLFGLNVFSSLLSITYWSVYHSSLVDENDPALPTYTYWYKICFRTFTWIVNFMTFIAVLHLFHYQGARTRQSMYRKREGISFSKLTKHSLKYNPIHPDEAKKLKK